MAKFEVGQRVKVTGNQYWWGEGIVRALYSSSNVSVTMVTGAMKGEIGAFAPSKLEPIVVFQPGDVVRAEKGDHILQWPLNRHVDDVTRWIGHPMGDVSLDDLESRGYTLTLVKRPELEIVLPTKNNALITFNSEKYIFNAVNGLWISLGTSEAYEVWEIKLLANVDDYRVIFEGENE